MLIPSISRIQTIYFSIPVNGAFVTSECVDSLIKSVTHRPDGSQSACKCCSHSPEQTSNIDGGIMIMHEFKCRATCDSPAVCMHLNFFMVTNKE